MTRAAAVKATNQMPCLGRLAVITLPDKTAVGFESQDPNKKPVLFSIPKVCVAETADGERLCKACLERAARTAKAVEKRDGKYVPNQQILLHGCFGEPLPVWSHMYGGEWFTKTQAEKGLRIPAAVSEAISDALGQTRILDTRLASTDAGLNPHRSKSTPVETVEMPKRVKAVEAPPVEPVGEPTAQIMAAHPKPKRATKKVGSATALAEATPEALSVAPSVTPTEPSKKFAPKRKKAEPAAQKPIAVIQPTPLDVEVVEIKVRKTEIDGRIVYLSSAKDKVYDLKFNYIGRYNRREDRIESRYADSDRE